MIHYLYNYFLTRKPVNKRFQFQRWLHWQLFKYLKVYLIKYYENISPHLLGVDIGSKVIVSLTSFPARIDLIYLTIRSILYQTKRPLKVVLWLGEEQFLDREKSLPKSLLNLKKFGLEIEFCKDIKAHKKYFFAFQKYPDNLIVTIDDDVIYPRDLLEKLIETHQNHANCVVANRVRWMDMDSFSYKPYRGWKINQLASFNPSKKIFSTGVGGVLYQPRLFINTMFDIEGINQTNCMNDDVWLKACQIASGLPVVFTNFYFVEFIGIPGAQKESLFSTNVFENDNDRQIKEVFEYFDISSKSFE